MANIVYKNQQLNILIFLLSVLISVLFLGGEENTINENNKTIESSKTFSSNPNVQLPFILNEGQLNKSVKYYTNTFAGPIYVTDSGEIVYSILNRIKNDNTQGLVIKETFNYYKSNKISGKNLAKAKVNYLCGSDRSNWINNLPTYNTVSLGLISNGISLELKASGNNAEKIFTVSPGANVHDIKVTVSGTDRIEKGNNGELVLKSIAGNVSFTKPVAYQEFNGRRNYINVSYAVNKNNYSFDVGEYNRELPLIIDPLLASTMLGGWCDEISYGPFIELDDTGNVYLSGFTCTPTFPTSTGAFQPNYAGGTLDCFIVKFNNDLTELLACTFLGGSGFETECSITLDNEGNIYAGGYTDSEDFPTTTGAYNETNNGGYDIFIAKLSNDLSTLIASTYIGGSSNDGFESNRINLKVGANGDLYVAGQSRSTDFPTTPGAYDPTFNGVGLYEQSGDVVVFKMDNSLSTLIASTYLGGSNDEYRVSVNLDKDENVFVSTSTLSSNIPTVPGGGYDESFNGVRDVFISKLSNDLTTQLASTYFGSTGWEVPFVVEIGENDNVYLCGFTSSTTFPTTPGAFDEDYNGGAEDAFIARFDNNLTTLLASTLFGGDAAERGQDLVLYEDEIYIVGKTLSADFPIIQGTYDDDYNGGTEHGDMFVSRMDSNLTTLFASTFLGGTDDEKPFGIEVDTSGNVIVGGFTHSSNYPTTPGAYDRTFGGIRDVTVSKLLLEPASDVSEEVNEPQEFKLYQNYPNPFNPATKIKFQISRMSFVKLYVYDVLGNQVVTLLNNELTTGEHEVEFNAANLPTGIYYYRLVAGNFVEIKKMLLLK